MAGILAERARMGATVSSIRRITSAVRAVEYLQWTLLAVTTLYKRIVVGVESAGPQPYLPPLGFVILEVFGKGCDHKAAAGPRSVKQAGRFVEDEDEGLWGTLQCSR